MLLERKSAPPVCVCVCNYMDTCLSLRQVTVNSMSAFFLPPDDLQLDELTNATLMKLEQFRDRTSTGQSPASSSD